MRYEAEIWHTYRGTTITEGKKSQAWKILPRGLQNGRQNFLSKMRGGIFFRMSVQKPNPLLNETGS
jgi:hypothetical protein